MMNYADDNDPYKWIVAAQFETSLLGLIKSVSGSTTIDFDKRRHHHLEGQDYHRALASTGLDGTDCDVGFDVGCAPDSFCKAFVQVRGMLWSDARSIHNHVQNHCRTTHCCISHSTQLEFFEDVGAEIWDTLQKIGDFVHRRHCKICSRSHCYDR